VHDVVDAALDCRQGLQHAQLAELVAGLLAQLVGQRLPRILGVLDVPTGLQPDVQLAVPVHQSLDLTVLTAHDPGADRHVVSVRLGVKMRHGSRFSHPHKGCQSTAGWAAHPTVRR